MDINTFATREIPLDEFPNWSPWPKRLLGLEEWDIPERTEEKVDSEYDKDEYLRCANFAKEQNTKDADEVRAFEFKLQERDSICVSSLGKLYELPADQIMPADNQLLLEIMQPLMEEADTVVEIGCGYGINLWELNKNFPDKTYIGGEYSQNAIDLAGMLYADHSNINVEHCNFYDDAYNILEKCPADSKVVLFTRHAIEQLPSAEKVIQTLSKYFDRLIAVVHMEPVIENCKETLFDLMRKRYAEINDYNRDLLSLVQNNKGMEVIRNDYDVYGVSPFNPTTVLVWKPAQKQ